MGNFTLYIFNVNTFVGLRLAHFVAIIASEGEVEKSAFAFRPNESIICTHIIDKLNSLRHF